MVAVVVVVEDATAVVPCARRHSQREQPEEEEQTSLVPLEVPSSCPVWALDPVEQSPCLAWVDVAAGDCKNIEYQ